MPTSKSHHVVLPFGGGTLHMGRKDSVGRGMGSVLLRTGGPGAASSYSDMDDYIHQTGMNPYARAAPQQTMRKNGKGLMSLGSKLSKLAIAAPSQIKRKNITMSM